LFGLSAKLGGPFFLVLSSTEDPPDSVAEKSSDTCTDGVSDALFGRSFLSTLPALAALTPAWVAPLTATSSFSLLIRDQFETGCHLINDTLT
jgi:hypothetical protein